jgi:hypothetical protein
VAKYSVLQVGPLVAIRSLTEPVGTDGDSDKIRVLSVLVWLH